jgi:putative heme-binding domain-containing protein
VNCKSCHRLDGVGTELGPDLGKIGGKYGAAELLQQILEPSRTVDPKYTLYHVETTAGVLHAGLLVDRDETQIVLRDSQNQVIRIAAGDVAAIAPQRQSIMPELLLRGLTAQQAADLLAYLGTLK